VARWAAASTPGGCGATGGASGVLHGGRGLVQYAQTSSSAPPSSCS